MLTRSEEAHRGGAAANLEGRNPTAGSVLRDGAGPSPDASEQISQARLAPEKAAKAGASAREEAGSRWKAAFLDGGPSAVM